MIILFFLLCLSMNYAILKHGQNIVLTYGQIPEWPKGTDCKSAAECFGGSNPPLPMN